VSIEEISRELGLNESLDLKAAEVIENLSDEFDTNHVRNLIEGKRVLVFGCGPSLEADIKKTAASDAFSDYVVVSVDGATKALEKYGILPDIIVSDLDGDINSIIKASRSGSIVIVHAHADNTVKIRRHFRKLEGVVYATTQRAPTNKVLNFGGFTDGDRAVHLVEAFNPELILLAGMDFGSKIGEYSGIYKMDAKIRKLKIGRKLIEQLAAKTRTPIFNLTERGVELEHVPRVTVKYMESLYR